MVIYFHFFNYIWLYIGEVHLGCVILQEVLSNTFPKNSSKRFFYKNFNILINVLLITRQPTNKYVPGKEMSRDKETTRVSPPTYLSWPSAGLGRIFPPWLHKNFTLLLGDDVQLSPAPAPPTSPAIFHIKMCHI